MDLDSAAIITIFDQSWTASVRAGPGGGKWILMTNTDNSATVSFLTVNRDLMQAIVCTESEHIILAFDANGICTACDPYTGYSAVVDNPWSIAVPAALLGAGIQAI